MAITFNAEEILQIAVEIEHNGQAFYKRASEIVDDPEAKAMFVKLSEWEGIHAETFTRLMDRFAQHHTELDILDPDHEAVKYLQAIADGKIFKTSIPVEKMTSVGMTVCDVLWDALDREKDTVIFYVAFKTVVKDGDDREALEKIILEEVEHVRYITEEMERRNCKAVN